MEEKEMITITTEDGKKEEVEVVNYFTLESNKKDYVVYTDNKVDEAGKVVINISEIKYKDEEVELLGVEDDEVFKEIQNYLLDLIKNSDK